MKQVSYLATIGIGCLFSVGIIVIGLVLLPWLGPGSVYVLPCYVIGILMAILLSLLGALLGKQLTKTGMGAWMGALVIVFLGIVWLSSNHSFCVFSD